MTTSALKTSLLTLAIALGIGAAQAESPAKDHVALFLTIKTQEGQRDALVALWNTHLKMRAQDNPDHLSYVFALDLNDANTVYISEVYASQAAFQANSQSPWFGTFMSEVGPLLDGAPTMAMANPFWIK